MGSKEESEMITSNISHIGAPPTGRYEEGDVWMMWSDLQNVHCYYIVTSVRRYAGTIKANIVETTRAIALAKGYKTWENGAVVVHPPQKQF
jgi:hypothetical protein